MRVRTLKLIDFKRFTDFEIDLTGRPSKIVALVGPNGSGKSSVFDAFEEVGSLQKGRPGRKDTYCQKSMFAAEPAAPNYRHDRQIQLVTDLDEHTRTSFYIRSAYRFTPRLEVRQIVELPDVEGDSNRPQTLIEADGRLRENYERLIGKFYTEVYDRDLTGQAWSNQNIAGLNEVLGAVLDITISFLGNPVNGEGSLYFNKGTSARFPYENLSAGEKEVVDLVLDLYVKRSIYANSVICIDEPELHLNTSIQRKLLVELEKLVPEESQLWVATHSIGFLRAVQEELWDKSAVIDLTGSNFDAQVSLRPIEGTRADWTRIFSTALEDLTGLLAPRRIVYCEGRADPDPAGAELGLDAEIYNEIFASTHGETLFVSSGGGGAMPKNALLALRVLRKAILDVDMCLLKDRDDLSDADRLAFIQADASRRMLPRRELENYLFDKRVLQRLCAQEGSQFDEPRYDALVNDIITQDLKPVQQQIMAACGAGGGVDAFKRRLARAVVDEANIVAELEGAIF